MADEEQGHPAQSNSLEQMDAWELDENGCAPDCPIRILGEQSGERPTGAVTKTVGEPTKNHEVYGKHTRRTHYERTSSEGTAARYFAQFYPDDETLQERGETQLRKSDEVMSGDLPIDQVIHGDCRDVLKTLAPNSIDAIVCDPPAGIAFMGKEWDRFDGQPNVSQNSPITRGWGTNNADNPPIRGRGASIRDISKGRDAFISFMQEVFTEALRVLRPGGHAFVWALPRTSHWTATALENAGFETRDEVSHLFGSDSRVQTFMASLDEEQRNAFAQIMDSMGAPASVLHLQGQGFPKSLSVSAAIDKHLGQEREVVGISPNSRFNNNKMYANGNGLRGHESYQGDPITAPATPESEKWVGWHSAIKPSHENWLLVRKPLAEKTIAAQVLATGTGALNIDISRVGGGDAWKREAKGVTKVEFEGWGMRSDLPKEMNTQGRFPSNTLFSHSPSCVALGEKRVRGSGWRDSDNDRASDRTLEFGMKPLSQQHKGHYNDEEGCETVAAYSCAPDCPVRLLDQQSGVRKSGGRIAPIGTTRPGLRGNVVNRASDFHTEPSEGGASRYFQCFPPVEDMVPFTYQSKASRRERNSGCEALPDMASYRYGTMPGTPEHGPKYDRPEGNGHPTVKPVKLISYLASMICPPNGIILDPFFGSGTLGVAAIKNGFHFIGIEQDADYCAIARCRVHHAQQEMQAVPTVQRRGSERNADLPLIPRGNDKNGKVSQGYLIHDFENSDRG